jgi:ribose transport system ATP-binding protein
MRREDRPATADERRPSPDQGGVDRRLALSVRGVSKAYPGTRALDGVDLDVRYGEVHALVGGNGCGKSTLIKVLSGVVRADAGQAMIGGTELDATQIKHETVHGLGLRVVHQDPAVFPDLSVAENLMIGSGYPTRHGAIRWSDVKDSSIALLERFEIAATPNMLLQALPVATRVQVAIARALHGVTTERAVLILDEPTAALPAREVSILLDTVRLLASQGHAIVFVSHRLDEVMALTERVTVMRDGRVYAEHETEKLTEAELIESILGRRVETGRSTAEVAQPGANVLSIDNLAAGPLKSLSLTVRAGEMVGVAGLLGSGRTELLRAICGDLPRTAGTVELDGLPVHFRRLGEAIEAGLVLIPEDRLRDGAFTTLTVDENINLSVLTHYWRWCGFRAARLKEDARALRAKFRVKASSGSSAMSALSGGNQQKAILARWLRREPRLLLLDEPTQGVDVGARADIYELVRQATRAGGGALLVTSDLEELAQVADRAIVIRDGRVVAEVGPDKMDARLLNQLIYLENEAQNA